MDDNRESRSLANDVRFTIDKKINFGKNRNEIDFYNFGVEITKSLEPSLYDSISCASSRLFIKINDIKTFVYPYDSIQASCTDFEDSCVIRISSAAIDKLSYDEIKFVIGHEIGHYLLDHSSFDIDKIPELMMISKAREISCDILGLIACNSYENAISSIIKTQSGLTKINLNISDYLVTSISNIKKSSNKLNYSSHPSLPLRAKSLQLAKNYLLNHFPDYSSNIAFKEKSQIDEKINNDLDKYENKDLIDNINETKNNNLFWLWVCLSINGSKLEKNNSSKIIEKFGNKLFDKFKNNFNELKQNEVKKFVENKLNESLIELNNNIPYSFNSYINGQINTARNKICNPQIDQIIHKIKLSLASL